MSVYLRHLILSVKCIPKAGSASYLRAWLFCRCFPFYLCHRQLLPFCGPGVKILCVHSVCSGFFKCHLLTGNQSNLQRVPCSIEPKNRCSATKAWSTHTSVPDFLLFYPTQIIKDYLQMWKMTLQKQLVALFFSASHSSLIFSSSWSSVTKGCWSLEAVRENKKLPETLREEILDTSSSPVNAVVWAGKAESPGLLFWDLHWPCWALLHSVS